MERELTCEDRAAAFYVDKRRFEWSSEYSQREIATLIREAEERGRQSVRSHPDIVDVAEFVNNGWDEEQQELRVQGEMESGQKIAVFVPGPYLPEICKPKPREWSDLAHLEGRELRERLRSRALQYGWCARRLIDIENDTFFKDDAYDTRILIDLILKKEMAVTQEAERLWEQHLRELTDWYIESNPSYAELIERAGNAQYAEVIVHRAKERIIKAVQEAQV